MHLNGSLLYTGCSDWKLSKINGCIIETMHIWPDPMLIVDTVEALIRAADVIKFSQFWSDFTK